MPRTRARISVEGPHPVDLHVGQRIRLRRVLLGLSQEEVARKLGLSFQQLQKYEKGTNRVSASMLWDISQVLRTAPSFFYDEMPEEIAAGDTNIDASILPQVADGRGDRAVADMNREFTRLRNPLQRAVVALVRSIAEMQAPAA